MQVHGRHPAGHALPGTGGSATHYYIVAMLNLPIVHAGQARSVEASDASPELPDLRDEDLYPVLVAFYDEVAREPLLVPYFAEVDMEAHMPTIVDFWSTMVFHTRRYHANAFLPHLKMPGLTAAHFGRWLATLARVLESAHAGPNTERMKDLAQRVAHSMQIRLGIPPFVQDVIQR